MAFEGLTQRLQQAFGKVRGKGSLTEEDVKLVMREVRMALLEADVNYKVVKDFVKKATERCIGQEAQNGLSTQQQGITLSYDQEVPVLLAQSGVNEMSGARNLRRVIVEQVEDPLSELILRGKAGNEVRLSVRCGKMIINNSCEALAPA